jgi:hypothetical protein
METFSINYYTEFLIHFVWSPFYQARHVIIDRLLERFLDQITDPTRQGSDGARVLDITLKLNRNGI